MKLQIISYKDILKNVLQYFEIYGILLVLYVTIFTEAKKNLLFVFFLDVSIEFWAKWYFEKEWELYLKQRWMRRIITIPL
jgi:hypothetical protein